MDEDVLVDTGVRSGAGKAEAPTVSVSTRANLLCPPGHTPVDAALIAGRRAAEILEALPTDERGYTDDEIAAHYAATDRLLAAFRALEKELARQSS
jgi:hypothetical protein